MGLLDFFKKEETGFQPIKNDKTLSSILNGDNESTVVTREKAMQIPSLKAGIGFIADLVASLDVKLHKEVDGKVESVDDYRLKFLNDETGDLLNAYQMKQSMVRDFLLSGNGYTYVNKTRNKIKSLHYVETPRVSVINGVDSIFKDAKINVNGSQYEPYEFVILAQNTKDGVTGKGLLEESGDLLELAYNTLAFSNRNMAQGGIKRGVLKSAKRLSQEAMDALKQAWANLYSSENTSNVIILNEGLDFQELSQTSAELETLNTRKANDNDILNILKVPASILDGSASNEQYNNFIKSTIIPILEQFESSFNKSLLLETEKENGYFFAFDTKDLLKGNTLERFNTYKTAIESGVMTINECRYQENLDDIEGLDFIKMSLGHVLYNPDSKEYYVPNTGQTVGNDSISPAENTEGGENNESRS